MATTFIQDGRAPVKSSTGTAIASGDIVALGFWRAGVASDDIAASGATGVVVVEGVHKITKHATSNAFTQGYPVWWDPTEEKAYNAAATGRLFLGYAFEAATATATTGLVKLQCFAGEGQRVLAVTEATTLAAADFYSKDLFVKADTTGGAFSLTLPAIASVPVGAKLTVKLIAGATNAVTIDPNASEQINGGATFTSLDANGDVATFVSDGSAWLREAFNIA